MLTIRRTQPDDAGYLQRLYSQLVDSAFITVLPARLEELQHDPVHELLVAEYGGTVIASVADLLQGCNVWFSTVCGGRECNR